MGLGSNRFAPGILAATLLTAVACGDDPGVNQDTDTGFEEADTDIDRRGDVGRDTNDTPDTSTEDVISDTSDTSNVDNTPLYEPINPSISTEVTLPDRVVHIPNPTEALQLQPTLTISPTLSGIQHAINDGTQYIGGWAACASGGDINLPVVTVNTDLEAENREVSDINLEINGIVNQTVTITDHDLSLTLSGSSLISEGTCVQIGMSIDMPTEQVIDYVQTDLVGVNELTAVLDSGEVVTPIVRYMNEFGFEDTSSEGPLTIFRNSDELYVRGHQVLENVHRSSETLEIANVLFRTRPNGLANLNSLDLSLLLEESGVVQPTRISWHYHDYDDNYTVGGINIDLSDLEDISVDLPEEIRDLSYGSSLEIQVWGTSIPSDLQEVQALLSFDSDASATIYLDEYSEFVGPSVEDYPLPPVNIIDDAPAGSPFVGIRSNGTYGFWSDTHFISDRTSGDRYFNCDDILTSGHEYCPLLSFEIEPGNINLNELPEGVSLELGSLSFDLDSRAFTGDLSYTYNSCVNNPDEAFILSGDIASEGIVEIPLEVELTAHCIPYLDIEVSGVEYRNAPVFPAPLVDIGFHNADASFITDLGELVSEPVPVKVWGPASYEDTEARYNDVAGYTLPNYAFVRPELKAGSIFSESRHIQLSEDVEAGRVVLFELGIQNVYGSIEAFSFTFKDPTGKLSRSSVPPVLYVNGHVFVLVDRGDDNILHFMSATGEHIGSENYLNLMLVIDNPDESHVNYYEDSPELTAPYQVQLIGAEAYASTDEDRIHPQVPFTWGGRGVSETNPLFGNFITIEGAVTTEGTEGGE